MLLGVVFGVEEAGVIRSRLGGLYCTRFSVFPTAGVHHQILWLGKCTILQCITQG